MESPVLDLADDVPLSILSLGEVEPMECTPAARPFSDAGWAFELTPGGYRVLARIDASGCVLHSLHHVDITRRFGELAAALRTLARRPECAIDRGATVLDGEIAVLDASGRNDAQRLHRRGVSLEREAGADRLTFCAFDLLFDRGTDLRGWAWEARRRQLHALPWDDLPGLQRPAKATPHGEWLHRQAAALGRPGIVARRRQSAYVGGPSADWRWIPA